MAGNNKINFEIGFSVNKTDISQLQSNLQQIYLSVENANPGAKISAELKNAATTAKQLDQILEKTFNSKLGSLNVAQFNKDLKSAGLTWNSIQQNLSGEGNKGVTAFNQLSRAVLNTNTQLVQSNKLLDQMAKTFSNTVRWTITSSIVNSIANSIQRAYTFTKQLDSSLNDIRIVTGKSADEMDKFAQKANNAAKALGASTLDYSKASLIYYQQGLSDKEAQARAETTIKVANITGQTGNAVSEELTAVWNGYKVSAEETEVYIDKLAAVAATTASDLEELSTGMSKVASAANAMGVDFDDLNAQIATIVSVTRQAPESVGTALKTIYARLGDLKVDGVDEFGVKLGEVSSQLQTMGIEILDVNGDMRAMSDVMAEVAEKWDTWTRAQQQAAAVAMAGKRQYNNLVALFENWDMYSEALETSTNSLGTLQKQQDIYMESTEAKLKTLKATWEDLYIDLFDQDDVKTAISGLTTIVDLLGKVIKNFGGGLKTLGTFGMMAVTIFNQQIGNALTQTIQKQDAMKQNAELLATQNNLAQAKVKVLGPNASSEQKAEAAALEVQQKAFNRIYKVRGLLNEEEAKSLITQEQTLGALEKEIVLQGDKVKRYSEAAKTLGVTQEVIDKIVKDEFELQVLLDEGQLPSYNKKHSLEEDIYLQKKAQLEIDEKIEKVEAEITSLQEKRKDLNSIPSQDFKFAQDKAKYLKNLINDKNNPLTSGEREQIKQSDFYAKLDNISKRTATKDQNAILKNNEELKQLFQEEEGIIKVITTLMQRYDEQIIKLTDDISNLNDRKQESKEIQAEDSRQYNITNTEVTKQIKKLQELEEANKKLNEATKERKNINFNFDAFMNSITKGQQIMNTITVISSSFSSLAMSINSINTLFDVLNDKSKSAGEKTLQVFMTLGMSIPMVATSVKKLSEALNIEIGFTAKNIAQKKVKLLVDKANLLQIEATTAAEYAKQAAEAASTVEGVKSAEADILRAKAEEAEKISIEKTTAAIKAKTEADNAAATASKANPYGWILIALAAIVVATTAVIKAQEKRIETLKEEKKEELEKIKREQEQIKTNEELYDSYTTLYKEYEKSGEASEELKNKALEISSAYAIQAGRVLALAGAYKDLFSLVNKERVKELEKALTIATNARTTVTDKISLNAQNPWYKNAFSTVTEGFTSGTATVYDVDKNNTYSSAMGRGAPGWQMAAASIAGSALPFVGPFASAIFPYNLHEQSASYFDENYHEKIQKILDETGSKGTLGENGAYISRDVDMSDPKDIYRYVKELEETREAIKAYKKGGNLDTGDKEIQKWVDDYEQYLIKQNQLFAEDKEELEKQVKAVEEYSIRYNLANELLTTSETDKTTENIYKQVLNLKEQYQDALDKSEFNSIIADELSYAGLDEIDQVRIEFLLELDKKQVTNEVIDLVDNLNAQQIGYLQLHLDLSTLTGDLETWLNDPTTQKFLEYQGYLGDSTAQKTLLATATDKGFKEEDVDTLYNNSSLSIGREMFDALDTGDQLNQVILDYITNTEKVVSSKEELQQSYQDLKNQITEEQNAFEEVNKKYSDNIDTILNKSDKLRGKRDQLLAALSKDSSQWTEEERELIILFKQQDQIIEENIEDYVNYAKESLKYDNAIQTVNNDISKLTNTEKDYKLILEQVENLEKAHNAILDDIQSNYKTVTSMVEDYNKNHAWTIDNVQQLITMDNEYVAALQFENGQLSINEDAFRALTLAKLDDLRQTIILSAQEELQALAQKNVEETAYSSTSAVLHMAAAADNASEAAKKGAEAWDAYAASMRAAAGVSDAKFDKEAKKITDATKIRLLAVDNAYQSVLKGGTAFEKAMNSGGSSSKQKDKEIKDELDRYWEFKKAIDLLDKTLSRLDKTQSKLHGKELIASLEKENQLLEKQKANYEALLEEQKKEAGELQGQLMYYGATFKENGELGNYAELVTNKLNEYKAAIESYNAGKLSEEAFDIYEKQYEEFKKALERYDTLYYSEMQDTLDKLDDARRKQLENNLKAWETEIQIKLDLTKAERQWNDFIKKIDQDFRKIYSDYTIDSVIDTKNFNTYVNDINTTLGAIKDVENEIDKLVATGTSDMFESVSDAQKKLTELESELVSNGTSLYDLYNTIWDNYIKGLDQSKDKLEDINKEFDQLTTELEHQKNLIELIYGDKAYAKMDKFYKTQQKNLNLQIDSLAKQKDFWEEQFNLAYLMNKDDHNVIFEDMSTWTEDMRKAYDNMIESQNNLNSKIEEGIKNLQNNYLNGLAEIFDNLEKAVWGLNLDKLKDDWDRIVGLADEYLDDVEGAYEIQTLANKMDKDIAGITDLKNQQKLQAFREKEIEILREKENLTQTDVDLVEARYDIMLKEMALEDARNAKTSMKLTRNTSGNWTYQYVADEEDVADKQQDLLQSYQNLYKMADDAYQHAMDLAMSTYEEMQDKMREIAEDTTLAEEEKMAKIQEIYDIYLPNIEAAVENSELYRQEAIYATGTVFSEVCEQDEAAYTNLTENQKLLVDMIRDKHLNNYEEVRNALIENYQDIGNQAALTFEETNLNSQTTAANVIHDWAEDNGESVRSNINEALDSIEDNTIEFENELDKMANTAGIDFYNVNWWIQKVEDKLEDMTNKTKWATDNGSTYIGDLRNAVNELTAAFGDSIIQIQNAQREIANYMAAVGRLQETVGIGNINVSAFTPKTSTTGKGGNTIEINNIDQRGWQDDPNGVPGLKYRRNVDGSITYGLDQNNDGTVEKELSTRDIENIVNRNGSRYKGANMSAYISDYTAPTSTTLQSQDEGFWDILKEILISIGTNSTTLVGLATGGYTGDWAGDHGKLAMLHSKELVLNQEDTANFLSGIQLIRDMNAINGSIENSIAQAIANMLTAFTGNGGNLGTLQHSSKDSVGNVFNITAEFPNAGDVESIKQAILSLPNLASQYVH